MENKEPFLKTLLHFKNLFSADIASKALTFISIPLISRLLSTSDYGIINVFSSYVGIFVIIFTLNSYASIARYYYEKKGDFNQFVSTSIILIIICLSIILILFMIFRNDILILLNIPEEIFVYLIPLVFMVIINVFSQQLFIAKRETKKIAKTNIIASYG